MKYKRILLKLSGESLAGKLETGICPNILNQISSEIKSIRDMGIEIAISIGGGNIHRGVMGAIKGMDRTASDHMGMLATVINSIALQDCLERMDVHTRVMTAIEMNEIAEPYIRRRAIRHLEMQRVIIFAGGTGNPYFTTDTGASLRASEIDADIILKATKVDGVYDKDPLKHSDAVKFDKLKYIDVISKRIKVMDSTAITFCMDNAIDIIVFNTFEKGNIKKIINGEKVGTLITGP